MSNSKALSEIRKSIRKAWIGSGRGVDKATILDILVYKEVRGVARDKSMAEALEDVVLYEAKPPDNLEWYEQEYLTFLTRWYKLAAEMGQL